jgi:PBP1b-binding outer membrane lipoprotein LpoB
MISLTKGFNMKMFKLVSVVAVSILFTACVRQPQPVAMNLYTPNHDKEEISGVSVEITQDMIDSMKSRRVQR